MGRFGPSASQAGEVSTAGRRIGTRLSSTRDSLQKGRLNETPSDLLSRLGCPELCNPPGWSVACDSSPARMIRHDR